MNAAMQISRAENFQDLYSNQINLAMSPLDATLIFSRLAAIGPNNFTEELAHVRVSPQQLKVLSLTLVNAVSAWEAEFGALDINASPITPVDKMQAGLKSVKENIRKGSVGS